MEMEVAIKQLRRCIWQQCFFSWVLKELAITITKSPRLIWMTCKQHANYGYITQPWRQIHSLSFMATVQTNPSSWLFFKSFQDWWSFTANEIRLQVSNYTVKRHWFERNTFSVHTISECKYLKPPFPISFREILENRANSQRLHNYPSHPSASWKAWTFLKFQFCFDRLLNKYAFGNVVFFKGFSQNLSGNVWNSSLELWDLGYHHNLSYAFVWVDLQNVHLSALRVKL